tara:strand:- start:701 stop:1174 length:474 start_codon:yes stop_codon:yes gene_type:complete
MPGYGHSEKKPKMYGKPKSAGLKALAEKNPELQYVGKAKMMDIRAKMAMPKMVDDKNFPKMAQEMAGALVPKMDHAKMYKPTKYHDGPKMVSDDEKKKDKLNKYQKAYKEKTNMKPNPFKGMDTYRNVNLDERARTSDSIPAIVIKNIRKQAAKKNQ